MLPLTQVHHVGIACHDIDNVRTWISQTHEVRRDSGVIHDSLQQADLCLLDLANGTALELVAGEIVKSYVKRRQTYYHLCYEVPRIDGAIRSLVDSGCRQISETQPAVLFDGRKVVFLNGPTGLLELLEQQ